MENLLTSLAMREAEECDVNAGQAGSGLSCATHPQAVDRIQAQRRHALVKVDETHLERALVNLVLNASRHRRSRAERYDYDRLQPE